ncbi:MAG TPA: tetratricopeptide repeat protein [Steroidobacteraceae bacterium]|jgi:cytochrome c-type biogenesis protein CcmH|nr:tetratricopeptide repeat protein [Steroidobacteraceae bacterium]
MSGFIAGAAVLALIAVLFVVLPLVRVRTTRPPAATAAVVTALALIALSVLTYRWLGNPAAIRLSAANARTAADSIAQLARHVERDPQDFEGWLKLGGAYEQSNDYPLALNAYRRADELAGGQSAVALAGMGVSLLIMQGAQGPQVSQAAADFERALAIDPQSPTALFYSAILAEQSGHLELARTRMTAMLSIKPTPPANVRALLQQQISALDAQLHPPIDAATAIRLHVSLSPKLAMDVPANASLFVFVQAADGGAPLAVRRSDVSLPQDLVLSAKDAMIAQRAVRPGQKVTVVARISATGSPLAQKGDLYGQIEYVVGKTGPRSLEIDKLNP